MNKNIKKLIVDFCGQGHPSENYDFYRINSDKWLNFFAKIYQIESLLDMKGAILKIAKNPDSVFDKGYISKQIRYIEDKIREIMEE